MKKVQIIQSKAGEFLKAVEEAVKIGIAGHVHPDGDCLGAILSLKRFFEKNGKKVTVHAVKEDVPESYSFLPSIEEISEDVDEEYDLFVAVDCPNLKRLGKFKDAFLKARKTINIDHHSDNENFADFNLVIPDISSTSEIVYWLLKSLGNDFTYEESVLIYVGIVTDTGRFQYSNTGPSTFLVAKELVERGVSPVEIFRKVYENVRPEVLKLLGVVLERVKSRDGFYWSYLESSDFSRFKVSPPETENFIDYIRAIRGVKVAALFKSFDSGSSVWKVSMRSRGYVNVQKLCAAFGGGGHPEASGCEVKGSLNEALEKIYEEYRKLESSGGW